ncbi:co-chaperone DjlA [Ferrimonas balearica]|uniref:co-chaperone DjlA n=1 Tax=Ferrimonas balearica TaxID=44012 RepID=UPI001C992F19|nr:co-chaperone DjlA [Ferrimonas balearica]MBY5993015.1 co-chaperone DjlA [Ferrimonas balearica]
MAFKGKLIGALVGFLFGRIAGLLLGAYLGHVLWDRRKTGYNPFFHTTFSVMGHIAKSGGRVTEADIALASALMDRIGLRGAARRAAQEAYREGKAADFPLAARLKALQGAFKWRRDLARVFLEIQIQAALADGELSGQEERILAQIAEALGFSPQELAQLVAMWQGERRGQHQGFSEEAARQVLGVGPGDDQRAIKRAYRKLMAQHHPDKLASQGLPPEMAALARQKSQDIQAAWEVLRQAGNGEPKRERS